MFSRRQFPFRGQVLLLIKLHLRVFWFTGLFKKNILFRATIAYDKKNCKSRNYKEISEDTCKKRYETIKDHSTSIDLKTIRNYPSSA